jgi:predicted metalloendopeptidase
MRLHRTTLPIILFTALVAGQEAPRGGADRASLDPTCKPCDDFWRYANGGWLDKNPIPARYPSWGRMPVMREANQERLRAILEGAAQNPPTQRGSNERKIGDFYASCLDTAAIDAGGIQPLQAGLERVSAVRSVKDLAAALAEFQQVSMTGPFLLVGMQDLKNSKEVIANLAAGGLSLPDRDYYFKDDARSKQTREEFLKHVGKMFELLGEKPERASAAARTVMALETELAGATMTNVERRDPYARYHRMDLAGLAALAPDFDWKPLLGQFRLAESTPINVAEPEFMKKFNQQMTAVPLEDWKTWLRWRLLNGAAAHLSKPFVDQDFYFKGTILTGVKEQQPRWQTCTATIDSTMGEALGELFVRKHFPPEAKRRMSELVENLRATLREELETANWLTRETRKNAIGKLNAFVAKIGYPDRWRDYSGVNIERQSYFENVRAAGLHNRLYQLAKIGKPVDRNEWGMTPPTVNAYYSPVLNEIVFPAGMLQPPMFDMAADDAANYGAIGAVIGHEMGHGFDDQGSKFDAEGNLKNWWTPEDRQRFEERAGCVIDQFNNLDVGEGLRHNGKLVVGEGMGDLGGLTLAYRAYKRSLRGQREPPVIDGFTADQRFFLAFARVWGAQYRPEATRLQLNTNPHPLPRFRANGTLQNMPEFHRAFQCKPGDPMVRPPGQQCKLW